ncbi:hypothetical protein V5799_027723 [Amblyomma americanum]|uniref:BPTI/Kunitz inhibitor domain-containing protein n=1 Tax=Amblyomma americanum TaxID=6943 RepID=A0AAQ4DEX1_AMBAM
MIRLQVCVLLLLICLAVSQAARQRRRICRERGRVKGPCDASKIRWSFNQKTGRCIPFIYGGCGGTRNRFPTCCECFRRCTGYYTRKNSRTCHKLLENQLAKLRAKGHRIQRRRE